MEIAIVSLLIIVITLLISAERILFGTFLTPITLLSLPYLFIILIIRIFAIKNGFLPFYYPSLLIWIVGLICFSIPGIILATIFLKKTNRFQYLYCYIPRDDINKTIFSLTVILILVLIKGFFDSLGTGRLGTEEFGDNFGTGISGHALLLSRLLFVYLIVEYRKKNIIPIILLLFFYFAYGSKTWILVPTFAAIITRIIIKKTDLKPILILKLLIFGALSFIMIYKLALGSYADKEYLTNHFFKYLFAGSLGISQYTKSINEVGINPSLLINPVVNIYNKITGSDIQTAVSSIETHLGSGVYSNVKTFFGTIYIYGGIGYGIIFCLYYGTVTYVLLILAIYTKQLIILIIYSIFLASFVYGWFDLYLNNLMFYEIPVFGIFILLIKGSKFSRRFIPS